MPGKNPHRPEGKAPADEWQRRESARQDSRKKIQDVKLTEKQDPTERPSSYPAEEEIGGSRPGVESRVKRAIDEREPRE